MKYFFVFVLLLHLQVSVAQKNIAEWKAALATAKHDTTRLRCYGGILEIEENPDTVLKYIHKADGLTKKYPNHPANVMIYVNKCFLYQYNNRMDSANYYLKKAHNLSLTLHHDKYIKLTDYYQTYSISSVSERINILYQLLQKYEYDNTKIYDKSLQYNIYNDLAQSYLSLGSISKAQKLIYTGKSLRVNTEDSVSYYDLITRLIALDAENTLKPGKSHPKVAFSDTYKSLYAELYSFSERNILPDVIIEPLFNYGHILFCEKKYTEAQSKAQELLDYAKKYKNQRAMVLGYSLFAEIYLELGQYVKAIDFAQKSNIESGILYYRKLKILSKAYLALGDYEKAYKYLLETTQEEERLKGINEQVQTVEIEKQVELNKKENEITTHKTLNQLKEERIKAEQQQKNIVIALLLLSLGLLAWAVWSYRKQRQLSKILDANNKLISQQATELKDSNLMKDKIFALLSHDLRTPINRLILALNSTLENQKIALMHELHNVQDVLNNVLYWSSMQVKKNTPQKREIHLKPLVDAILNDFDFMLHEKQIEAINAIEPNSILFSDENYLKIILRNLISNAVKFTQPHGFMHISYKNNQHTVAICVRDTGVGIATEKMGQLFHYPDSSLGTKQEVGSGLGLSLCYEIAKLLKGDLIIDSQVQQGTKVILELPNETTAEKNI